jgi:ketosteroid isomerase-like protein
MKSFVPLCLLLTTGFYLAGCAEQGADPAAARQEIEQKNQLFQTHFAQENVDSLVAMYTADAIVMAPGEEMSSGADAIASSLRETFDASPAMDLSLETVEVQIEGQTAYEVGRFVMESGGQHLDHGKYLVVWKNDGGDWKLHREIFNTDMAMPVDTSAMPADTTAADTTSM